MSSMKALNAAEYDKSPICKDIADKINVNYSADGNDAELDITQSRWQEA